jgi:hypothetical protein
MPATEVKSMLIIAGVLSPVFFLSNTGSFTIEFLR